MAILLSHENRRLIAPIELGEALSLSYGQRISTRNYTQSEGLSNQVVMCPLQDHTGFIWVGTENGLFRYDGRNFVRFDTAEGLPSAVILLVRPSAITTGPALLIFSSNKRREYLDKKQGLPETSISCVLQDREGSIWLDTWGGEPRLPGPHHHMADQTSARMTSKP